MSQIEYEDAKRRTTRCNNHLIPVQRDDGSWYCGNCDVDLRKRSDTISGFRHRYLHPEGGTKICSQENCDEPQPLKNFYTKDSTLDGLSAACRKCTRVREKARRDALNRDYYKRTLWIPKDLWHAMEKVRGRQSVMDFIYQALRAEVERRARDLMAEQARAAIEKDKPRWVRRLVA